MRRSRSEQPTRERRHALAATWRRSSTRRCRPIVDSTRGTIVALRRVPAATFPGITRGISAVRRRFGRCIRNADRRSGQRRKRWHSRSASRVIARAIAASLSRQHPRNGRVITVPDPDLLRQLRPEADRAASIVARRLADAKTHAAAGNLPTANRRLAELTEVVTRHVADSRGLISTGRRSRSTGGTGSTLRSTTSISCPTFGRRGGRSAGPGPRPQLRRRLPRHRFRRRSGPAIGRPRRRRRLPRDLGSRAPRPADRTGDERAVQQSNCDL